ncbi:putative lysM and putative peptidoglycan-binding domain-containing protein 3-like [Scophthalmus maximus]|uniref:LysM and putative peptidoglycan-binding domain-containing protein 3 n=1 Tax=Scophthalmus maximus TaxID=52904 RepID=A0A2U9BU47_SCOMX|nr:lysM and putative peptidoglycan-binding domain-containing protein 3 [Scophthalmus maximus]XP_035494844.1 lysM and putative peptidoglycan-binding domain-containing protein 3 [Scophthalmus maximus]XP_035494845.1 lysM and putative peptidoglycan-binding domain-containing protein 3 [Scophthalmus maximus]XP_035494846.1 lysM and putative peptidoglycan-binding domain-containing protein 3 [Scophthalmus maximus]AWP06892.1 putative lysM and putative peptidoglycan-binding domain-containing protein 3-lik
MTSRSQHYGFQSATVVQPANGGHTYLFGNNGSENDLSEEDGENYELRPRGRERLRRSTSRERMDDIIYLTRDIQEGDTLNSFSLQYHCSVADIKRANNLLTEQDFFALRSVKIPVKRFSVLTETHTTGPLKSASPSGARRLPQITPITSLPSESSTDSSSSTDSVEGFLLEKDKDIERLVKSTGPSRNSLNEVVSSLTLQQQPLLAEVEYKPAQRKDPYYGADWGMRWWTAVAIMLFVGIVTPVFYLLYYEVLVKADVSHHGIPTQANGHVPHGNVHGNNLDLPAGGDMRSHAGAGPGHHAGNVVNGDLQELDVDKPGGAGHGGREKT